MAGLLSKGITIACRGFTGGVKYEHTIKFDLAPHIDPITQMETPAENDTFKYYNDSPASLVGTYTDLTKFFGATCRCSSGYNLALVGTFYGGGMMESKYYKMVLLTDTMAENEFETSASPDGFVITSDVVSVVSGGAGAGAWTDLTNLQEIAELGNNAREKIDVTTLDDDEKKYIDGLSDTAQDLAFKFLYDKEQFAKLAAMEGVHEWRVTLPDGATATFNASPSVKIAGAGVSAGIFYTLTLSLTSKVVFA